MHTEPTLVWYPKRKGEGAVMEDDGEREEGEEENESDKGGGSNLIFQNLHHPVFPLKSRTSLPLVFIIYREGGKERDGEEREA